jgi:hypothetical protein
MENSLMLSEWIKKSIKHKWRVLSVLVYSTAIVLTTDSVGRADPVPIMGPRSYNTDDPESITVEINHGVEGDRTLILHVPRSAIILADGYSPATDPVLPGHISVKKTILLSITAPDGQPLGEAVEARAKDEHGSLVKAMSDLRSDRLMITIGIVGRAIATEDLYGYLLRTVPGWKLVDLPPVDGLRTLTFQQVDSGASRDVAGSSSANIFLPGPGDLFDVIRCDKNRGNPLAFCDYYKRFSDLASMEVKFVDFRYHGGREFLNSRMQIAMDALCRFSGASMCQ